MRSSDPIHEVKEPERCNECRGDGYKLAGHECYRCDGRGGWPKGWYFWNEVWADRYGPYDSETKAREACKKYAEQL